jgi:hypothetical protein
VAARGTATSGGRGAESEDVRNTILFVVLTAALIAALIVVDRLWLDPGGRGFAGEANDFCVQHGGVKEMNAYQGFVICWDGTAR